MGKLVLRVLAFTIAASGFASTSSQTIARDDDAALIRAPAPLSGKRFVVFDLGRQIEAHQVGNSLVIAGTNARNSDASGVRWVKGSWRPLEDSAEALAVNGRGDVAGYFYSFADRAYRPKIWPSKGDPIVLQLPGIDFDGGRATAIANDGSSAGWVNGIVLRCFRAGPDGVGTILDIYNLCYANAMNNHGQIVGVGEFSLGDFAAFVWQGGDFTKLGKLAGTQICNPTSINDLGEVVGRCETTGFDQRAFYWKDGAMTELKASKDYLWTSAEAINDRGDIVGYGSKDGRNNLALRFIPGKQAIDLNKETANLGDWRLVVAKSINDEGVIVGIGYRSDELFHTFALVPTK